MYMSELGKVEEYDRDAFECGDCDKKAIAVLLR